MPIMTFDRVLKIIGTVLSILSAALSALQGISSSDVDKEEGE